MVRFLRKACWFASLALVMALVTGTVTSVQGFGEAQAAFIPSHLGDAGSTRGTDIDKVRVALENKVVAQRLMDYGVSAEDAKAKLSTMSDSDLHRLASVSDRLAAGANAGGAIEFLILVAVLVILVIVILKLMNKEVVIR